MFYRLVQFFGGAQHQSAAALHHGGIPVPCDIKAENFLGSFRHIGCSRKTNKRWPECDVRILAYAVTLCIKEKKSICSLPCAASPWPFSLSRIGHEKRVSQN